MKASVILVTGILTLVLVVETRAQEGMGPLAVNLERPAADADATRAPAMVVHEPATVKAPATTNPAAPKPIVVPAATASSAVAVSTGNPNYDRMIMESAARNGIDPALIVAIMRQESGFKPNALSHKGARGLMQLIPATARRFGVANIWDPAQNIEGGARYLRFLLDTFNGDVKLALAGYNAGENAVIGAGYRIPRYRETQAYVRNISARYGSDTHRGARGTRKVDPQAPQAMLIDAGSSSRFSNNY